MSMTIQQAIENRERCYNYLLGCGPRASNENVEAVRLSLEALREKAEREDPKPLTLEELRQMDGEPVWVHNLEVNKSFWMLAYKDVVRNRLGYLDYSGYGKTWIAYRHKPKEG